LLSGPQLAQELLDTCGPTEQWRTEDDEEDFGYVKRAGTEVYDNLDNDDEDDDDAQDDDAPMPLSIASLAAARAQSGSSKLSRPGTEVGKFQGVELTSIINLMDLEVQGARPLVDLDSGAPMRLADSGPSLLDSGPSATVQALPYAPSQQVPMGYTPSQQAPSYAPPPYAPMSPAPIAPRLAPAAKPRGPAGSATTRPMAKKRRARFRPWMVVVAILLAAGVAALIVAMSGPDVGMHGK
jgi:hypothetical protein